MGDELDDLFHAFEDASSPPPAKKPRTTSTQRDGYNKMDESSANDDPDDNNPQKSPVPEDKEAVKKAYSTVMNLAASSQLQKKPKNKNSKIEVKPDKVSEQDREIATGTSHDKSVRSYTALPKNLPSGFVPPKPVEPPTEPAKVYPFELDPFQKKAIEYIDREESVLVAAHTSAGKTAIAEYAVAKSLKRGQRVAYCSPIKALSNEKFRSLQEEFGDVGLMTGDMTINPDATALVMTTEILLSMLYRGGELLREIAIVIYDEVHYMRDTARGVVWEESIILLPHRVRFVFLSATLPNAPQFADWVASIHHHPCHVVYTNYRPVPLQHYIFPKGGEGLHLVVDEQGKFREGNFQKAMATLQSSTVEGATAEAIISSGNGKKKKGKKSSGKKQGPMSDLHRIVKLVMMRNLNPVIIFSFSKKDCEKYALSLNQDDYTDEIEKDLISQVYSNAIESLSEDDQRLPQVEALLPLLKRGIGIHHGGLLPILKEIVEILFSEGLIKTLFATETFAIGINMPAKTVVFTNTRKWDGTEMRWLSSGEYIQMSGRAGRRGKDDRGIVIQMLDEKMEPAVCKNILYGEPDPLNSSYRISYNMLLNLLRVEDVDPEYLLRASFYQFQREKEVPGLLLEAESIENEAAALDVGTPEEEEQVSQYFNMEQQLLLTKRKISKIVRNPEYVLKFLQSPGRLLEIVISDESFGWGVLVSCKKRISGAAGSGGRLSAVSNNSQPLYTLEVLLRCVDRHFDETPGKGRKEDVGNIQLLWRGTSRTCRPVRNDDDKNMVSLRVFTVSTESIERLSAVRIFIPQDVTPVEARRKVSVSLNEVKKRFPDGIPLLDPVQDLGIKDAAFRTLLDRAQTLAEAISSHQLSTDVSLDDRADRLKIFQKRLELTERAKALRNEARSCQTMAMKEELKKLKRVLKKLGHVDAAGVIQTKGRTACEINTANELVVVELIFSGVFNDLSTEQCVALLSCLIFDENLKEDDSPAANLKSFLSQPFLQLQSIARDIARTQHACGVEINEEEFLNTFNPNM